ncbi:hypothetical protein ABL850_11090 [Variovorax paradoxus]|jgi:hypothetical protein|uniref:hypothetical protein n=1 Tax=Variovorax paradoxus TaxID=34073 RepID=UPI003AAF6D9D
MKACFDAQMQMQMQVFQTRLHDAPRVGHELLDDPVELVQLSACGHGEIFDLFDAHGRTSYLVLRVLPLGNEFGENADNPRLAISPATSSWSLPISSDDGELA